MKKNRAMNYIYVIVLAIVFIVCAALCYFKFLEKGLFERDVLIINILLIVLFYVVNSYLHVLVHELGHMIFGFFNKFKLYSFSVGCFMFSRKGLKIKFKNHYGTCVMIPKTTKNFYRHTFLNLLGGSVASLILAAVSGVFLFADFGLSGALYIFLGLGFLSHTYMLLREFLPYSNNVVENDGAKMLGIIQKTPRMRMSLKLFSIQTQLMSGKSPSEIEEGAFYDVPILADNDEQMILMQDYRYLYHIDRGEIDRAIHCIDIIRENLDDVSDFYYMPLMTDIYFTELYFKRNADASEKIYDEIFDYLRRDRNISNLRVMMAHDLFIIKDVKSAIKLAKDALALYDECILQGVAKVEKKLIDEMLVIAEGEREKAAIAPKRVTDEGMWTEYRG